MSTVLVGCGDDSPEDEEQDFSIADTPLAGKIAGESWTFVAGDVWDHQEGGDYHSSLYPVAYEPCGAAPTDTAVVMVSIPPEVGEYEINLDRSATFVTKDYTNVVTFDGKLSVIEITATEIRAGLHIRRDDAKDGTEYEVNGQFTVTLCD